MHHLMWAHILFKKCPLVSPVSKNETLESSLLLISVRSPQQTPCSIKVTLNIQCGNYYTCSRASKKNSSAKQTQASKLNIQIKHKQPPLAKLSS